MSFALTSMLVFLGLLGLLALTLYLLGVAIKWQANKPVKRFFAPIPRPGSFSFPALEGKVIDILENVDGWRTRQIRALGNARCFVLGDKESAGLLEGHLGVRWIGLFATIKTITKWKWLELQQVEVEEKGKKILKYTIIPREEPVSEFFFQFQYPVTLEGAEIEGNIQVKITAAFIVLHFHPVRAFFLNKDPTTVFNTMVLSALRSYVKNKTFDDVKAIKASMTDEGKEEETFWQVLRNLNGVELLPDGNPDYNTVNPLGLFGKLGDIVVRGEVLQVEAVGEAAAAIEAQRLAELQGNAEITKAEKAGQARVTAAQKDAKAFETLQEAKAKFIMTTIVDPIKAGGDSVGHVLEAQVLTGTDSKLTVLVQRGAGTGTTIPIGKQ